MKTFSVARTQLVLLRQLFARGLNTWEPAPVSMLELCDAMEGAERVEICIDPSIGIEDQTQQIDARIDTLQRHVQTLQQALIKLALLQSDAEKLQCLGEALRATAAEPVQQFNPQQQAR